MLVQILAVFTAVAVSVVTHLLCNKWRKSRFQFAKGWVDSIARQPHAPGDGAIKAGVWNDYGTERRLIWMLELAIIVVSITVMNFCL